ncbi:MAG: hypothetical protein KJ904_11160 [Alphaproteobacteria bacterium]|nr:hypothetical protein [Alphaproteobacteria bacterium]MBU0797520.1 hypothetical protein [Alphaproteobacteria bacterium]MBU0887717.1 hypothetical protein [Alphaproteobacteria bacterium]MBU1813235.1 hypothetical protein [Alphaproteobacteria bacterium]
MALEDWAARASKARHAAHRALAHHESSASRIVLLEDLTKSLSGNPVDVQDYFSEAISCLENKLYRSGIILAWAGHFHVFSEICFQKYEADIRAIRPKWSFKDLTELKENVTESHFLNVAKDVKFTTKAQLRILDGQLSQRNQCAHPTLYRPSMNAAIGYVDDMIRQTLSYLP